MLSSSFLADGLAQHPCAKASHCLWLHQSMVPPTNSTKAPALGFTQSLGRCMSHLDKHMLGSRSAPVLGTSTSALPRRTLTS